MAGGVEHPNHPIVVFDGICNLCNRWVDFLIRHDRNGRFRVTPNQGETALTLLGPDAAATDTIVLFDERGRHDRSTAVLRIAGGLPWPWKAAAAGLIVPPPVRNGLYKLVARNRFRWWGRRESCRLPTPDEQERFLP
jgi:predicted DCC family thiol-disulfide oxidoreductase YuxK